MNTDETLVPGTLTPTGIGIGQRGHMLIPLSPCCGESMCYRSSTGPVILCERKTCKTEYTKFTGIPTENLAWGGKWTQCYSLSDSHVKAVEWIERWTGLDNVRLEVGV